jgi:hypothetical protein
MFCCADIRCRWGTGVSTVLRTGAGVAARTSHFLLVLRVQQARRCRPGYEEGAPVVSRIVEKAAVGACRGDPWDTLRKHSEGQFSGLRYSGAQSTSKSFCQSQSWCFLCLCTILLVSPLSSLKVDMPLHLHTTKCVLPPSFHSGNT